MAGVALNVAQTTTLIETAEADAGIRAADARRRWLGDHLVTEAYATADASAVFAGHWTHLTQATVVATDVLPETLDAIESFFRKFVSPPTIHVSSHFSHATRRMRARGYSLLGETAVLGYARGSSKPVRDERPVCDATDEEEWIRASSAGFLATEDLEQHNLEIGGIASRIEGIRLMLVRVNAEPAATAALLQINGTAILLCDSTRTRFRGLGLQKQLIGARVEFALNAGAERIVTTVRPGSTSERNYRACGFERLYSRLTYRKL